MNFPTHRDTPRRVSSAARPFGLQSRALAVATAAGSLVLAGCGLVEEDSGSEDRTVHLSISGIGAADDHNMRALQTFADEVERASGGTITYELHQPNTVLTTPEALNGTGSGIADVAIVVGIAHPNELPATVWMGALASAVEKSFPAGQLQGGAAVNELFLTDEEITTEYEKQNVKILNSNVYGQQFDLLCREPVTSVEDFKGLRVRSPGPVWTELAKKLGMEPTFLTNADIFEALQRGVIDCEISPPEAHVTAGSVEVAREYTPLPLTGNIGGYTMVMNLDTWNSLSEDQQDAVSRAAAKHWSAMAQAEIEAPLSFVEASEKYDVNLHEPTPEMLAAVASAQQQQIDDMVAHAPEGVADPQDFINRFEGLVAKWHAQLPDQAFVNPDGPATFATYEAASKIDFSAYYDDVAAQFSGATKSE